MTTFDLHTAKHIIVRYGRKGEQLALYCGHTPGGKIKVRKYRANSFSWTGFVVVTPAEVLRPASAKELDRVGVPMGERSRAAQAEVFAAVGQKLQTQFEHPETQKAFKEILEDSK